MDPISQGTLGAALAESLAPTPRIRTAAALGVLAGMAPDLDVLIHSPSDPLLFLEYHRQFTHSLVFIPAGAFICALIAWPWARRRLRFAEVFAFCFLGYATHGLLDACTTYGTQLLWPFSDARIAWNNVSIIDPLFTIPTFALAIGASRLRWPRLAQTGMAWALLYLVLGVVQRERAEAAGHELAAARGHAPERLEALPTFANLLLWRVIYEADGVFHVDGVRVGLDTQVIQGERIEQLDTARQLPWLPADSQQARDIERFRWFSNDYLALDPTDPRRIIDIRYSILPNRIDALWAIEVDPALPVSAHVRYRVERRRDGSELARFWRMLASSSR